MINEDSYDGSASGYVEEAFEGLDRTFSDVEILHVSNVNVVAKGKRYGRWWLLKGLKKDVAADAACRLRLRKELEVLMQLQHPNIVGVAGMESVGSLGECIVMEFVDGPTLREWLRSPTTRRRRRKVARELTAAVGYMHSKNIVHRDLKPENVVITANGENVKIVDFGLADTDSHAILKQPAGTPRYMSPEQTQTPVADVRNDIYSLGVLFREMNLGYGRIAAKCLLSSDRRYRNADVLLAAMRSHDRRRAKAVGAIALLVIFLQIGFSGVQFTRLRNFTSQLSDSHAQRDSLNSMLTLLNDSFDRLSARQQQTTSGMERQHTRLRRVDKAVGEGCKAIDRAVRSTGVERHFDTLSNIVYMDYDILTKTFDRMSSEYNIYIERIKKDDYTDNEISEIANRISSYDAGKRKKLVESFNRKNAR